MRWRRLSPPAILVPKTLHHRPFWRKKKKKHTNKEGEKRNDQIPADEWLTCLGWTLKARRSIRQSLTYIFTRHGYMLYSTCWARLVLVFVLRLFGVEHAKGIRCMLIFSCIIPISFSLPLTMYLRPSFFVLFLTIKISNPSVWHTVRSFKKGLTGRVTPRPEWRHFLIVYSSKRTNSKSKFFSWSTCWFADRLRFVIGVSIGFS